MPRATNAPASRRRRKRVLNEAKGYFGNKSKLYRYATEAVNHAQQYAYRDRRAKKRTWRALWITRINAGCRAAGISYSRFIEGLDAAGIELNRKVLADIAARDEAGFATLVEQARNGLKTKAEAPRVIADDLTRIEGIGPKAELLLNNEGIKTFAQLAAATPEQLEAHLARGGLRFKAINPGSWPQQAAIAAKGDWTAFAALKKELKSGNRV